MIPLGSDRLPEFIRRFGLNRDSIWAQYTNGKIPLSATRDCDHIWGYITSVTWLGTATQHTLVRNTTFGSLQTAALLRNPSQQIPLRVAMICARQKVIFKVMQWLWKCVSRGNADDSCLAHATLTSCLLHLSPWRYSDRMTSSAWFSP